MADTTKLVQGSDTLNLNDTTNYETKQIRLAMPANNNLWHVPDRGESQLVTTEPTDRQAQVLLLVHGTDEDNLQNNIVTLRRWCNEASRYDIDGDNNPVYLQLQKNGATNAVNHLIKYAYIDDSASHYTDERTEADNSSVSRALNVAVNLILAPYGEFSTTITLQNDCYSSPHAAEDSDADGLSDGWAKDSGGNSTANRSTSRWLIGGYSQTFSVTADVQSQWIRPDVVTATTSDPIVAYIWIGSSLVTNDTIKIYLKDGSDNTITSATFDPSNVTGYDKIITSAPSPTKDVTFYRYVLSDDGDPARSATNVYLQVARDAGDANQASTYFLDGAYIEVNGANGTTAPDAWMSARKIDNRCDIQSTSQATENYLNYIDVWGSPGDAQALAEWTFTLTSIDAALGQNSIIASMVTDGYYKAPEQLHWIESNDNDFTYTDGPGTWSNQTGTTNNHFKRHTASSTGTAKITWTPDDLLEIAETPRSVYAAIRPDGDSQASTTIRAKNLITGEYIGPAQSMSTVDYWDYVELGILNLKGVFPRNQVATPSGIAVLDIEIVITDSLSQNDFDFLLLHYATERSMILTDDGGFAANDNIRIIGSEKAVIMDEGNRESYIGAFWDILPGNITSRAIFTIRESGSIGDAGEYDDAMNVVLELTPRTRHLLGT